MAETFSFVSFESMASFDDSMDEHSSRRLTRESLSSRVHSARAGN